jgi:hypothetical protein
MIDSYSERDERDEGTARSRPTEGEIARWMRAMLQRAGIETVVFRQGTGAIGLVHVPDKYCAVIAALHAALITVAAGEALPEITTMPPKLTELQWDVLRAVHQHGSPLKHGRAQTARGRTATELAKQALVKLKLIEWIADSNRPRLGDPAGWVLTAAGKEALP